MVINIGSYGKVGVVPDQYSKRLHIVADSCHMCWRPVIRSPGIDFCPSKTTSEQRADILAKYAAGVIANELARQHNVSHANILEIAKSSQVYSANSESAKLR